MATNNLKEMRIVLIGKTGAGKSSLGNNLLSEDVFESLPSGQSVTKESMTGRCKLEDGRDMIVVDTPGLFDTTNYNKKTFKEISRCVGLSSPGPHIFMWVLRTGRFTKEELETIEQVQSLFGEIVCKHMVVVFTCKENLQHKDPKKSFTLEQFVKNSPENLQKILRQCGDRYVGVNNNAEGKEMEADMEDVMMLINQTIEDNGGDHYTGEMYTAAEKALKEKIRKIEDAMLKELNVKESKLDKHIQSLSALVEEVTFSEREAQKERMEQALELQKLKGEMQKSEKVMSGKYDNLCNLIENLQKKDEKRCSIL